MILAEDRDNTTLIDSVDSMFVHIRYMTDSVHGTCKTNGITP